MSTRCGRGRWVGWFAALFLLAGCTQAYDVVVVGGGTGGTAAAIEAARGGARVLVVEESPWLGGMLTSAGVSAIDGNYRLDGKVVNIPSYSVSEGQVVAVREKSKSLEVIQDALAGFNHSKYSWIEWDESIKGGKLLHMPVRDEIPEIIKEQLIVELYSKQ